MKNQKEYRKTEEKHWRAREKTVVGIKADDVHHLKRLHKFVISSISCKFIQTV